MNDIFQYLDYRLFLKDFCESQKASKPSFSQRAFARSAGIPLASSSFLPAVITGKRNLSANYRLKFTKALRLNPQEAAFFDLLVQFNQAKTMAAKNQYFSRLSKFRNSKAEVVLEGQYRFYSSWYFSAVWNYFGINKREKNPREIARHIFPAIGEEEVREAIALLLDLGLIKKLANGFTVTHNHITTEKEVQAMVTRRYVRTLTEMAMEVFEAVPAPNRQYSAMMFSVSKKGFDTVKHRIRSFHEELREILENDQDEDRICTLATLLYPNTQIPSESRDDAPTHKKS